MINYQGVNILEHGMDERYYSSAPHMGLKDNVSNTAWKEHQENVNGTWLGEKPSCALPLAGSLLCTVNKSGQ